MVQFSRSVLGDSIHMTAQFVGPDIMIHCYGGTQPHIGAVSMAYPYVRDGKTHASVSTITMPAHRDNELSQRIAVRACTAAGRRTVALCGIHYDEISAEGIQTVISEALNLCGLCISALLEQID